MSEELRIISMHQPWASWVLWEWKTIETRTHRRFASLEGKRIGIHAAKHWDEAALTIARPWLTDEQIATTRSYPHQHGTIICTVFVFGVAVVAPENSRHAMIECETERFGLFLHSRKILNPPIPAKGKQGIWRHVV